MLPAILFLSACAEPQIRYPVAQPVSNCKRGNPRAMLSRANSDILQTHFKLLGQSRSREIAYLRSRVKLTVIQVRCEKITTRFIFELPQAPRRLDHRMSWYKRASVLMDAISGSSPAKAGLKEMASRLRVAAGSAPPFGTALEMGEFQHLSLQVGENLKGTRTLIEIGYTLKI